MSKRKSISGEEKEQRKLLVVLMPFIVLICVLLTVFNIKTFFMDIFQVPTASMEPTIMAGDYIVGKKYVSEEPKRAEVIVFDHEEDGKETKLVKRIIGLPGEVVGVIDGQVYINGTMLDESSYISSDWSNWTDDEGNSTAYYEVPENSYFVMGDNRLVSYDSRYWGFVPREDVIAKVYAVLPINKN